ncbi:hypothetical protein N2152v2_002259 [Parachlorella kessleri]
MVGKVSAVDYEATWSYPKEQDGWFLAHNALRADLAALQAMLDNFDTQLKAGTKLEPAQQKAATRFLDSFLKFLHHHHHNEDDIVTPYLATRCQMPDKISADHKEMEVLLVKFEGEARKLLAATNLEVQMRLLLGTKEAFVAFHQLSLEHLREEEEGALPLMRKHFTHSEIKKNLVAKISRSMTGEDVGVFLRPMTKEQRRAFAKREGIPFFIRWILFRQAAKHERKVWQPFQRECLPLGAARSA